MESKSNYNPFLGYIVEKRAKDSDVWVKVNDYPVSDCGYTVNGLPEGGEFEFRVRAVNQAGEGEPSGTTGLIKIKEKIGNILSFIYNPTLNENLI